MSNGSKIVGGDVFINGAITMYGHSRIGLSTNAVNVRWLTRSVPLRLMQPTTRQQR